MRRNSSLTGGVRPVVAGICRRLDGMPLAIDLADARARSLTPSELAQRLDHRSRLLSSDRAGARP